MEIDKMNKIEHAGLCVVVTLISLGGLYFYLKHSDMSTFEGMTSRTSDSRCPNILIQKGAKYYLYNSKLTKIPGVNPIMFNNLEEYVDFIEWQRGSGIRCPVLYVQNSYDAQGERVYKIRPSAIEPQGGLPPSSCAPRGRIPVNRMVPPRQDDQIEMDENMLHKNDEGLSADPMDPNWGGVKYTASLVRAGVYKDNEIYKSGY
jgi:hypothetical protein